MTTLSQISLLKSAVSEAFQAYLCAELGDSSVAHKALKEARANYSAACIDYVEEQCNILECRMNETEGEVI